MILFDKLYTITSVEASAASVCYKIHLNPDHVIYQAHFPGEPITPGACIVQIAQELASMWLQCELEIAKIINLKFLSVIKPEEVLDLDIILEIKKDDENGIQFRGSFVKGDTEYTKMSLLCHRV